MAWADRDMELLVGGRGPGPGPDTVRGRAPGTVRVPVAPRGRTGREDTEAGEGRADMARTNRRRVAQDREAPVGRADLAGTASWIDSSERFSCGIAVFVLWRFSISFLLRSSGPF